MSILYRNDKTGVFPESWYAASAEIPPARPALDGDARADVAVVGAGFTGLSAALELQKRGFSVIVLDAHRAGFGASGRNGGQVWTGFRQSPKWVEAKLGGNAARAMWDMSEAAKDQVRRLSAEHAPDARYTPGLVAAASSDAETAELAEEVEFIADRYGYTDATMLDTDAMRAVVKTKGYVGGIMDRGGGHIHPLRYVLGLARAVEAAGGRICELTEVTRLEDGAPCRLTTPKGTVTADHVIMAGNGYMTDLVPHVAARVMPINSFIAATEPLDDPRAVLGEDVAVGDSKFVVNYYRMSEDNRFLFGGREAYSLGFPEDIQSALYRRMLALFPQLEGVKFTHVWGGTLGITMNRMPLVARVGKNVLNASGFSGQGVALSGFAGTVMAEAIAGHAERFDLLSTVPSQPFPGGAAFRAPLLTLAMTWFSLRDRLGI
ncbi:NAD(P)/FAD-dependent oxidoreductase [Ovoidimarina sediminis]|uniref:NAD(P)/FAD-dependent oxidoreductase n=1 Tax=Ovoidimarina sediminis TaxID=3079856 RepID=UPI00290AADB7|nr:FAD-binding oxidoreductase [Rhodophyticola sp. MJ-SS7]MDU8942738.1 FAD-binding oxidoreductase [Rhodophyticola sp. MJ-SS7]